ncbi:MAG: carbamoyltransferase C-terminal domain-containing protein [Rhodospirillaceae bacterium]|nr:carbamoyltransferase C-terminal domain-containing protein [Rhodospirillaceae bacterium]
MLILGINQGAGASVVVMADGRPLFALEEERVQRRKGCAGFPVQALAFTLDYLKLNPASVDAVMMTGGADAAQVMNARAALDRQGLAGIPMMDCDRHTAHAASAYYGRRTDIGAPYLVLSLDEGGDGCSAAVHIGEKGSLRRIAVTPETESLTRLFGAVTDMMGMVPGLHDYKLMGLAPYADPDRWAGPLAIMRSYLDLDLADPLRFRRKVQEPMAEIGPRLARDLQKTRFDHLAGATQAFAEDLVARWVRASIAESGIRRVVAAGSAFMNVKVNQVLAEIEDIDSFDVFPSCGSESLAFGAAWLAGRRLNPSWNEGLVFDDPCLGPDALYDFDTARTAFRNRLRFERLDAAEDRIAELLVQGHVVGRCSGRMEFGARALGNRSLLADPADHGVTARLNRLIKQRDFWMPFAPAIPLERLDDYIRIPASLPRPWVSPYMMHAFDTTLLRRDFPAATHPYDGTARVQAVPAALYPGLYAVLSGFSARTGRAALLNTSFNRHGEPIVMGAHDAMTVLAETDLGHLVIGDWLVTKPEAGI